jgi:hypothetical protein
MCVKGIDFACLYAFFRLDLQPILTVVYIFYFLHFILFGILIYFDLK